MTSKYPNITQRQALVLAAVVKEHCETGEPVASQDLIDKGYFDVSSATLRNEMQALEKEGYIHQPHTSSGRVPTDLGFRMFVSELMERTQLSMKEQERLRNEVVKLQAINSEIGRRLAKLLAETSSQASFALLPGETSTVGLSNILNNPSLPTEDAREIAEFFDHIDEYADSLLKEYGGNEAKAVIGKEVDISKNSDYSMIVSGISLPDGKKGVVGLLGPKSMKYQKNMGLLEYISKLLGGGGAVFIVIQTINHLNI